jgi:hypothetical protein
MAWLWEGMIDEGTEFYKRLISRTKCLMLMVCSIKEGWACILVLYTNGIIPCYFLP